MLGVAVEQIGNAAPIAIGIGALLALLAAWSYSCLSTYYEDEGATYALFERTYPASPFAAAAVGWAVVFGYISTLALYSFTFSSYLLSLLPAAHADMLNPISSAAVLALFALLNIVSVKKMGRVEDFMVYSKLVALVIVTIVLYTSGSIDSARPVWGSLPNVGSVFFVAALTFMDFEGFQLIIHAYSEVNDARRNVPRAIYISMAVAGLIYIFLAEGALWSLDKTADYRGQGVRPGRGCHCGTWTCRVRDGVGGRSPSNFERHQRYTLRRLQAHGSDRG